MADDPQDVLRRNIDRLDAFKPEIYLAEEKRAYATMLVELDVCGVCSAPMLPARREREPFPMYNRIAYETQGKVAGWQVFSGHKKLDRWICKRCADAGAATFVCAICAVEQPATEEQEHVGIERPDFLCKVCYSTVPAKAWAEKVAALEEAHRYDGC